MKEQNNKAVSAEAREERISLAIGIVVVLAVLATIMGIIIAAGVRNGRAVAMGEISTPIEMRRGTEQTLTYSAANLKNGDTVTWYVDGKKVAETKYDGKTAKLNYTPDKAGQATVKAECGKYCQSKTVEVKKPVLTVRATEMTITYGETLPKPSYTVEGFVGEDTADTLNCKFDCNVAGCTGVGVWDIVCDGAQPNGYEVHYENAHLTVLPKVVCIANTVRKVYDQTNSLAAAKLVLDGVLDGDDVTAKCDTLYFASKNAGYQNLMTANIRLEGKDAHNYVLSENAQGYVAPRKISLTGVKIADKYYDGTTKAQIDNPGTLVGVLDGDSVAIGSLEVTFDSANVGKHTATAQNIALIGVDKDNYVVTDTQINDGEIMPTK